MWDIDLPGVYAASCAVGADHVAGEVYHVRENRIGSGSMSTPVARYFARQAEYSEGFNPHWRLDCYMRKHKLAGNPEKLTRALAQGLIAAGHITEPMWMSWHRSEELAGDKRGALWEES